MEKNQDIYISESECLSALSDDLLGKILIRLPDFRSKIECSTVWKRWLSLISQPQFICNFVRHHKRRPQFPQLLYCN